MQVYPIEELVSHRQQPKFELEVKWLGYSQTTWEPIQNIIEDQNEMVTQYFNMKQLKVVKASDG